MCCRSRLSHQKLHIPGTSNDVLVSVSSYISPKISNMNFTSFNIHDPPSAGVYRLLLTNPPSTPLFAIDNMIFVTNTAFWQYLPGGTTVRYDALLIFTAPLFDPPNHIFCHAKRRIDGKILFISEKPDPPSPYKFSIIRELHYTNICPHLINKLL